MNNDRIKLSLDQVKIVEDSTLNELEGMGEKITFSKTGQPLDIDKGYPSGKAPSTEVFGKVSRGKARGNMPGPEDNPFELEIVKPRAIDLKKLWKLASKPVPQEIEASLGATVPVLLYHGMTPFARPGEIPKGIWGMGYEVQIENPTNVDTIALLPSSELFEIAKVDQNMKVGLSLGGEMKVPDQALEVANGIPGINLHGVEVSATTDQNFSLALHVNFSVVKIMAGPVNAGGARWDLYRQDDPLERFQPLLQTILLPVKTGRLKLTITTWIKKNGLFGGIFGTKQWSSKPASYEVSLEGLNS